MIQIQKGKNTNNTRMQVGISSEERAALILATRGRGRAKWFTETAKVSYPTMDKLRKRGGMAEEFIVEKIRAALKMPEVRRLIKESEYAA